ncbi:MAG: amidase [Chloroflexota bacterium]|jgi:Asp-tRNA(Asn)/Glu-tRNA(Gln) amidotransferase A subunit family amidase
MTNAYNLTSLDLPKLNGRSMRLFASALDNAALRNVLLGPLMRQGGIATLRDRVFTDPPTFYPYWHEEALAQRHQPAVDWPRLEKQQLEQANREPFANIADYAHAFRVGTVSPESVAEAILAAIADADDDPRPLHAFRATNREDLMAQARASAQRLSDGAPLSLLDGVPVAVKDEVDQLPYGTTVGTSFLGRTPATMDGTIVARLRAAGAMLIGKTNMYEIGINPEGFNSHYGIVRNPYRLSCHAGGSSNGSAVAVAAGFCPVAIGADGGGSIRIPAALNGVVGLKATFGRISEDGAAPLTWTMGHLGPIGATVSDVALVYACIAGPDERDSNTLHQPPVSLQDWNKTDLRGLTLGIYQPWFEHAAPSIVASCQEAVTRLVEMGATVREIEIPALDEMRVSQVITILTEMASNMEAYNEHWAKLSPPTRVNLTLGKAMTSFDYLQAQRVRTQAIATFRRLFREVDVILSPATAVTAPTVPDNCENDGWSDLSTVTELMRFAMPGNLTGLPAIAFPIDYDKNGLPISMQAMARPWQEHILLQVAHAAEHVTLRRRPPVFYDILGSLTQPESQPFTPMQPA